MGWQGPEAVTDHNAYTVRKESQMNAGVSFSLSFLFSMEPGAHIQDESLHLS